MRAMREVIICKHPHPTEHDAPNIIWMACEISKELDKYIATAMRMRPNKITIEYEDYLK